VAEKRNSEKRLTEDELREWLVFESKEAEALRTERELTQRLIALLDEERRVRDTLQMTQEQNLLPVVRQKQEFGRKTGKRLGLSEDAQVRIDPETGVVTVA